MTLTVTTPSYNKQREASGSLILILVFKDSLVSLASELTMSFKSVSKVRSQAENTHQFMFLFTTSSINAGSSELNRQLALLLNPFLIIMTQGDVIMVSICECLFRGFVLSEFLKLLTEEMQAAFKT